jgi:hypothetical protein
MTNELQLIKDLIARIDPLLTVIEDQLLPPLDNLNLNWEYLCTQVPKEELEEINKLLTAFDKRCINLLFTRLHKTKYNFSAADGYTDWLIKNGKQFGYQKSIASGKEEETKDSNPFDNVSVSDAEKMIEMLKKRLNL